MPSEKFDIGTWAHKTTRSQECATTACALGWATNLFHGLSLYPWTSDPTTAGVRYRATGWCEEEIIENLFGSEVFDCFFDWGYVNGSSATPMHVASKLRKVVAKEGYEHLLAAAR